MTDCQQNRGILFVVSGPSGSGKSSIYKKSFELLKNIEFSVSCTTRPPRIGERNGIDYYFVSEEDFNKRLSQNEFAEHAEVHGNHYGTLKSEILTRLANGKDVLLDIDVQGARQIKELCRHDQLFQKVCVFIFVMPPSLEILEKRLRARGTETEEVLVRRLNNAREEIKMKDMYDYVLINDDLEKTVSDFIRIITNARNAACPQ